MKFIIITFANFLRIVAINLLSIIPPILGALEEIGFAVLVGECGINIAR
jgi:hypothetical protein